MRSHGAGSRARGHDHWTINRQFGLSDRTRPAEGMGKHANAKPPFPLSPPRGEGWGERRVLAGQPTSGCNWRAYWTPRRKPTNYRYRLAAWRTGPRVESTERLRFTVESNAGVRLRASVRLLERTVGPDLAVRRSYGGKHGPEDEMQHDRDCCKYNRHQRGKHRAEREIHADDESEDALDPVNGKHGGEHEQTKEQARGYGGRPKLEGYRHRRAIQQGADKTSPKAFGQPGPGRGAQMIPKSRAQQPSRPQ